MNSPPILVRLHRPEGYEDVHPELVVCDAKIDPAFLPEIVDTKEDEQLMDRALRALEGVVTIARKAGVRPTDITQTIVAQLKARLGK